jgi:hypothetical protein
VLKASTYIILVMVLVLSSCKESEEERIDFGYDYAPIGLGKWTEFYVDSIFFDEFNPGVSDTQHFLIRETFSDTFSELNGNLSYIIERQEVDENGNANGVAVRYSLVKTGQRLEKLKNNARTVELVFPFSIGTSWDGNAFNNLDKQEYECVSILDQWSFGGQSFDSVATIVQYADTNNFIFKNYREEKFAKNVGLVYREYLVKEIQISGDSGVYVKEWVKNFGG